MRKHFPGKQGNDDTNGINVLPHSSISDVAHPNLVGGVRIEILLQAIPAILIVSVCGSYNDFSLSVTKKMPVMFIYTMNASEEYQDALEPQLAFTETLVANGLGPVERIVAYNTTQVKDYNRYEMAAASQGKAEYREQHWDQDLQKAYEAGKRMAQRIG